MPDVSRRLAQNCFGRRPALGKVRSAPCRFRPIIIVNETPSLGHVMSNIIPCLLGRCMRCNARQTQADRPSAFLQSGLHSPKKPAADIPTQRIYVDVGSVPGANTLSPAMPRFVRCCSPYHYHSCRTLLFLNTCAMVSGLDESGRTPGTRTRLPPPLATGFVHRAERARWCPPVPI